MAYANGWEFWIDVGGTFTDCLARAPDGTIRTHKLLSSGVYKGRLEHGSTRHVIRSHDRAGDPPGFFVGFRCTLFGATEAGTETSAILDTDVPIVAFNPRLGELRLGRPLCVEPKPGLTYELSAGQDAPIVGIRWLMAKPMDEPIGPIVVRLGTTRGTNALLERQGAATALVVTRGFRDVLRIAYQNRPKLFDLKIRKPGDLYRISVELDERIDSAGRIIRPLDVAQARAVLMQLRKDDIVSLAVCLVNSYRNPAHEEKVARIAGELGFEQVSVSSRVAPVQRIVTRGDTTVVDAYLSPIIRSYVAGLRRTLPEATLKLMTSAGGLVDAERFVGKDSVLSGPAGGVVAAAFVGRRAGFDKVIGFDMGGTSTDVSRFHGDFERRYLMEVNDPESGAGVRISAPMLAIETVAAGGGSICWFDGQKTCVGPRSAGSDPGPACYGRGGPLCITDVNLLLGRIAADQFAFPLDPSAAARRLHEFVEQIRQSTGRTYSTEELALGFVRVANANMAAAIKRVSVARGYDVRDYVLVSFGGAGAQHACALARELGIRAILQHPYAGILSAFGIGMADVIRFAERHVGVECSPAAVAQLEPVFAEMERALRQEILADGVHEDRLLPSRRLLDLRYHGQDSVITVPLPPDGDFAAEFERCHQRLYGFTYPGRQIEIHAARLELVGQTAKPPAVELSSQPNRPAPGRVIRSFFDREWRDTGLYRRDELHPGDIVDGPAVIAEPLSTIVVEPGWRAELTPRGDLLLSDIGGAIEPADRPQSAGSGAHQPAPDPILLELFNNHFASIAEQMGVTLQRTALSTNVKERLDFSCALFNAAGELIVNAPHIPVHLGAMSETVRRLVDEVDAMSQGDVFITNDPYRGGSHLNDVTVVTPVFDAAGSILFFTGSRAHHAEIGGIVPGSMPPFSKNLAEEGVLIRWFRLLRNNRTSEEALRRVLTDGPYPSRCVEENIADINAQVAANQTGVALLGDLIARYGLETVRAYMKHIQTAAQSKMRAALQRLPEGEYRFADTLDNGAKIAVTITIRHTAVGGEATVDFTGTDPVCPDNLNANRAIVRAAVLYSFRSLIDEDIPLNDGVLDPVQTVIPENCLLDPPSHADPRQCAAVVGGNVETSQRIVDVILGALGVAAASQGTMNNVLFGRSSGDGKTGFGYYETIGGGAGAGPGFAGASAVHTHMTNTRITDPEVLESRYPVRVREFSIRTGSGGPGQYPGGDGIVRELEFVESLEVSLLTNRRVSSPFGLAGGRPGAKGRNRLIRRGSTTPLELPPSTHVIVAPGDALRIETPGGGGYGPAPTNP
jgi:5-oxoprolinase (ATP-hydrolysing)